MPNPTPTGDGPTDTPLGTFAEQAIAEGRLGDSDAETQSLPDSDNDSELHADLDEAEAEDAAAAHTGVHPEMEDFIVPDDAPADDAAPTEVASAAQLAAARSAHAQRVEARFASAEHTDLADGGARTGATRFAAVLSRWEERLLDGGQLPPEE